VHGSLRLLLDLDTLTGLDARPTIGLLLERANHGLAGLGLEGAAEAESALHDFVRERLEYALQQRGAKPQAVRAVVRGRPVADLRPADVKRNVAALQEFAESDSFRKLAEAFKRVRNIARELKDAAPVEPGAIRPALKEPAEIALLDEVAQRAGAIERAVADGRDFRAAYAEAAQFQPAVDRFFTEVFVMVDDAGLRQARLRLMKRLEQLILQLGDISEIVAPES
jgi:glycyl-tRNA synthetase beta chain